MNPINRTNVTLTITTKYHVKWNTWYDHKDKLNKIKIPNSQSTLKYGQYRSKLRICDGTLWNVGSVGLMMFTTITMANNVTTVATCQCTVSLECWNLSCTILLPMPLPSTTNVIATDSSKQTLLIPSYLYWVHNVLYNCRNTWLDSLKTLWHFYSFPYKIYCTHSYLVCIFVCISTLFI